MLPQGLPGLSLLGPPRVLSHLGSPPREGRPPLVLQVTEDSLPEAWALVTLPLQWLLGFLAHSHDLALKPLLSSPRPRCRRPQPPGSSGLRS